MEGIKEGGREGRERERRRRSKEEGKEKEGWEELAEGDEKRLERKKKSI